MSKKTIFDKLKEEEKEVKRQSKIKSWAEMFPNAISGREKIKVVYPGEAIGLIGKIIFKLFPIVFWVAVGYIIYSTLIDIREARLTSEIYNTGYAYIPKIRKDCPNTETFLERILTDKKITHEEYNDYTGACLAEINDNEKRESVKRLLNND